MKVNMPNPFFISLNICDASIMGVYICTPRFLCTIIYLYTDTHAGITDRHTDAHTYKQIYASIDTQSNTSYHRHITDTHRHKCTCRQTEHTCMHTGTASYFCCLRSAPISCLGNTVPQPFVTRWWCHSDSVLTRSKCQREDGLGKGLIETGFCQRLTRRGVCSVLMVIIYSRGEEKQRI